MSSVYAAEFKLSIVDRIKAGETAKQLSDETGIHCNTIIQWNRRYRCGKKFSKKNGRRKIVTTPVQQALQSFFEARCTPTMEDVRSKIQEELAITENSSEIKVSKSTAYMAMKGLLESRHSLSEQPHFNNSKVNATVPSKKPNKK
jgi:transposase